MHIAIDQAGIAEENGDVPIGAVIVHNDTIIAKAYNQREQLQAPTAHADSNISSFENIRKIIAGKLSALIRIEYIRSA